MTNNEHTEETLKLDNTPIRDDKMKFYIVLPHLELFINSNILLPVKVGQGDLQRVRLLAGQAVEVVKTKPHLP